MTLHQHCILLTGFFYPSHDLPLRPARIFHLSRPLSLDGEGRRVCRNTVTLLLNKNFELAFFVKQMQTNHMVLIILFPFALPSQ